MPGTAAASAARPTGRTTGVADRWNGKPNDLANLTEADRSLIKDALGVDLNAAGVDPKGRAVAPMLVHIVAIDRAQGRLPAGRPISVGYLNGLLRANGGSSDLAGMRDGVDRLLDVLDERSQRIRSVAASAGPVLTSAWSSARSTSTTA